jgi:S1-C subfamily serine protease
MQDYSGYGQPPSGPGGFGGPTYPMPPEPPRPPRRRVGLLSYLGVALAAGALGAGTVVALYHPASSSSSSSAAPAPSSSAIAPAAPAPSSSPLPSYAGATPAEAAILKKVEPGLVIINTTLQYTSEEAAGTGMVLSSGGLLLTNNHVIENATKISATVVSTGKTYSVKVVGYDVTRDVALLQMQDASGLRTIPIGNSSAVKSGDSVVAMGNAEGQSQIVPAAGRITAINQSITASDSGGTVTSESLHGMLETNADIVSGDSGGPLANSAGQVIGMDTAGENGGFNQQQSSAGFAIPIATALSLVHQISTGQASSTIVIGYPPFVGVYIGEGTNASPQAQAQAQEGTNGSGAGGSGNGGFGNGGFGGSGNGGSGSAGAGSSGSGSGSGSQSCYTSNATLTVPSTIASVSSGTLVIGTICGSPADAAGLTSGSVITGVNGQAIGSPQSMVKIMSKYKPGATVSLTWVTPSGQHKTGDMTLTAGPPL